VVVHHAVRLGHRAHAEVIRPADQLLAQLADDILLAARERLQSLSWFMKCLKEPLARLANKQDQTRGAFFEERFKSIAILDEESLLATCAYIDLNPVAAGIVEVPEKSPHTSITQRVKSVKSRSWSITPAGYSVRARP
jgi:hypothetical protein